jgi:hypothetical protein
MAVTASALIDNEAAQMRFRRIQSMESMEEPGLDDKSWLFH